MPYRIRHLLSDIVDWLQKTADSGPGRFESGTFLHPPRFHIKFPDEWLSFQRDLSEYADEAD